MDLYYIFSFVRNIYTEIYFQFTKSDQVSLFHWRPQGGM